MKTILQKTGESLQEYASKIERLANLAFSDYPTTVREIIALQYFVDELKDGEIQMAKRMADLPRSKICPVICPENGSCHSSLSQRPPFHPRS
ncbi:uncharacterized protein TNCV_5018621 [Trichonephila clavipes]|nr:uncharacterized protein TNCV_5018621 [Trichonephila clavipes]